MPRFFGKTRDQVRQAQLVLKKSNVSIWLRQLAHGGHASPHEINEYLRGAGELLTRDETSVVAAVNEDFTARGQDHPVRGPEDEREK